MFAVYVLKNISGKLYIGQTNNIRLRLAKHNSNSVKSTKNRGPWKSVFEKQFSSRSEAMIFEKYLKKQKGGNGLRKILKPTSSSGVAQR